jgi:vacuolar-type H+-ATPase subunit H
MTSKFGGVAVDEPRQTNSKFGGIAVDESTKSDVPSPIKTETTTKPKDKSFFDDVTDIAKSGGVGGVAGFFLPEMLTGAGMVAPAIPGGAAVSPFLLASGQLARSTRGKSALTGLVGGAGASAGGKVVPDPEKSVFDIPYTPTITRKDVAETVGGFLGPGAFTATAGIVRAAPGIKTLWNAAKKYVGGESEFVEAATRELANFRNKFKINQLVDSERFRTSKTDVDSYRQVFSSLQQADKKTQDEVTTGINQAQKKADDVLAEYKSKAEKALTTSKEEAQRIINEGDAKAKQIIDKSIADAQQKLKISGKAKLAGEKATTAPQQTLTAIGDVNTPLSTAGGNLQQRISKVVSDEQTTLNNAYNVAKTDVNNLVKNKESQGLGVKATQAYADLQSFLNTKLGKGKEGDALKFAQVTEPTLKSSLETIQTAINDQKVFEGISADGVPIFRKLPSSFDALDHVRRRLGDVFSGKEIEGFKGLQKQQAMDLYKKIRDIQVEYTGGKDGPFDNLLKTYSEGKDVLDALKIPAGKKIIKKDLINPEYFTYDPSGLPREFFSTEKKVKDLINLTGDVAYVEKQASDYVARTLRDSNAKQAEKYLYDNDEWLKLFPNLKSNVQNHVNALRKAESVGPKTEALAKSLKTEIKTLPGLSQAEAEKAKKDAAKAAEERLKLGKKEASDIVKTGQADVKRITGAAGKLRSLGLVGDPVKEIEKLITSGQTQKLNEIAPFIKSDPEILKAFNEAIDISLSRANPTKIVDDWNRIIKPSLENNNLITPAKSKEISDRIRTVQMTLEPTTAQQTMRWIIKNAITTTAGIQAGSE